MEKTMQLANFNITFGDKEEAMLTRFEEIIYPAFTSGFMNGKEDEFPQYLLIQVEVKKTKAGKFILVGNFVKNSKHTFLTKLSSDKNKINSSPEEITGAPYSRFIIFLENHRMLLVKNEKASPGIINFQTTVKKY